MSCCTCFYIFSLLYSISYVYFLSYNNVFQNSYVGGGASYVTNKTKLLNGREKIYKTKNKHNSLLSFILFMPKLVKDY